MSWTNSPKQIVALGGLIPATGSGTGKILINTDSEAVQPKASVTVRVYVVLVVGLAIGLEMMVEDKPLPGDQL